MTDISRQLSDVAHEVHLALSRADEAFVLLDLWKQAHPDDGLARASDNLIRRWKGQ